MGLAPGHGAIGGTATHNALPHDWCTAFWPVEQDQIGPAPDGNFATVVQPKRHSRIGRNQFPQIGQAGYAVRPQPRHRGQNGWVVVIGGQDVAEPFGHHVRGPWRAEMATATRGVGCSKHDSVSRLAGRSGHLGIHREFGYPGTMPTIEVACLRLAVVVTEHRRPGCGGLGPGLCDHRGHLGAALPHLAQQRYGEASYNSADYREKPSPQLVWTFAGGALAPCQGFGGYGSGEPCPTAWILSEYKPGNLDVMARDVLDFDLAIVANLETHQADRSKVSAFTVTVSDLELRKQAANADMQAVLAELERVHQQASKPAAAPAL